MRTYSWFALLAAMVSVMSISLSSSASNDSSSLSASVMSALRDVRPAVEVSSSFISDRFSLIEPANQLVNPGNLAPVVLKATLRGESGELLENAKVNLLESGELGLGRTFEAKTNSSGVALFDVSGAASQGAYTYLLHDPVANKFLSARASVAYLDNNIYSPSVAATESYVSADHLEFSDLPTAVRVGESVSFTLNALDLMNENVVNYNSTVRFSVKSGGAQYVSLPPDYTFVPQDLGEHTFSLGLAFAQPGTYVIEARDLNKSSVFAEATFVVDAASLASIGATDVNVSNPLPGTYSNNVQVISGTAPAGSKVKIFDNGKELTSLTADVSGNFSFTSRPLTDGAHKFYAATVNDIGTIISSSKSIDVVIDTSAPEVANLMIEPGEQVSPGSSVKMKLYTEDSLSQASVVVGGNIYDLTLSNGAYEVVFLAPSQAGTYKVDVVLVDQLGNETRIDGVKSLFVGVAGSSAGLSAGPIQDVANLRGVASERKVTLNWDSAGQNVKNYRVYYGLEPTKLSEVVDTFTNSTSWYVPNLKNGVTYYFAVVAVDEKGAVSQRFSNIVSAVPTPSVVDGISPEVELGYAGADALESMSSDVSETGPDLYVLLFLALVGGYFYAKRDCLFR